MWKWQITIGLTIPFLWMMLSKRKWKSRQSLHSKMTGSWLRLVPRWPFLPSLISASLLFAAYSVFNQGKSFQEVGYTFCLFLKISTRTMAITSLPPQRSELMRAWCWSKTGCLWRGGTSPTLWSGQDVLYLWVLSCHFLSFRCQTWGNSASGGFQQPIGGCRKKG